MILDREVLDRVDLPPVIIAGSGPAGISLAYRLAQNRIPSLILEAGPDTPYSEESQQFYAGDVVGDPYFDLRDARLRRFGGTSGLWAGVCRPLDTLDFVERRGFPNPSWPITASDLDAYATAAHDIFGTSVADDEEVDETLRLVHFDVMKDRDFAEVFRGFFRDSDYAHVLFDAPVERFEATADRACRAVLIEPDGRRRRIETDILVLAAGGIENSRILLWSNAAGGDNRVVADDTTLGRYWMEHPHGNMATVAFADDFHGRHTGERFHFAPSLETLEAHRSGNFVAYFDVGRSEKLAKDLACAVPGVRDVLADALNRQHACGDRVLSFTTEQDPSPERRVALAPERRDAHGVPLSELHWTISEQDYRTLKVAVEMVGRAMVTHGMGMVRADDWVVGMADFPFDGVIAGYHHMGGTRMATRARDGIVDRDLRVFDTRNLYVLGSSVFPTGGFTNPTFPIVQLGLRLADHLSQRLGAG